MEIGSSPGLKASKLIGSIGILQPQAHKEVYIKDPLVIKSCFLITFILLGQILFVGCTMLPIETEPVKRGG